MLRTIFIVILLGTGLIASVRSRFGGLVFYIWFALFRPQEWLWVDLTPFRLSLVIGILFIVPALLSGVLPDVTHPLTLGTLLFLGSALLAQINAVNPAQGWLWLDFLTRLVIICLMAVPFITTEKRFVYFMAVVAGSLGFHGASRGLAYLFAGGAQFTEGLGGAFGDNNDFALGLTMIIPLLVATGINTQHTWSRRIWFASVPLTILTIVGLNSRGAFLGLTVSMLVWALLQRRRVSWLVGMVLVTTFAYLVVPIPAAYFQRLQTIRTYEDESEGSALGRLHFWHVALRMVADRPLGVGLRNFESAYDRYDDSDGSFGVRKSVHNSHLQVLTETGVPGMVIWVALFVMAFKIAFRIRRRARSAALSESMKKLLFSSSNALIASMMAFLVGGTFLAMALNDLTWLTFCALAALDRLSLRFLASAESLVPTPAWRSAVPVPSVAASFRSTGQT